MAELTQLATLICGGEAVEAADPDCEISEVSKHLKSVLTGVIEELKWLGSEPNARITLYGPFLARTLLEVGVTALIGRLDPTRLLVVKRTQQHGDYNTGQAWNSAIRWKGDVVDDAVSQPWKPSLHYKDMTKALFGHYYIDIYWTLALKKVADSDFETGTWLAQIKNMSINEFATRRRDEIGKLYSESSKGVHSEFVVPPGSLYDKLTISNLITKTIHILAELGLLINLLPHIPYKLEPARAAKIFNDIEGIEVMQ